MAYEADSAKWYVLTRTPVTKYGESYHRKSGGNLNKGDLIQHVSIPLETVTEITDNGTKTGNAQGLPVRPRENGHVRRDLQQVSNVRASPVRGLGQQAIPLTEEEIAGLGVESGKPSRLQCGRQTQNQRRRTGILPGTGGDRPDRGKVRVVVSLFGRETPVELDLVMWSRYIRRLSVLFIGRNMENVPSTTFQDGGALSGTEITVTSNCDSSR